MLETKRQKLEAIDPEYAAIRRDQREHKEMQSYRKQGEVVAAAMKSTFEAHLQSLQLVHPAGPAFPPPPPADGAASGSAAAGHAGGAPQAAAQDAKNNLSRSELGWLRTILGPKHVPEDGLPVADLKKFVVSKMSDKLVVGSMNKVLGQHFKKTEIPKTKGARVEKLFQVIQGDVL